MTAALTTKTAKTADATPVGFPLGFLDRAGDGASFATLHALVSAAGALVNPATAEGVAAIASALAGVLNVQQTSQPLPIGASTEATLLAIKAALLADVDLSETVWLDNTGAYFIRRDVKNKSTGVVTPTYTDPTGTPATPGAGLRPFANEKSRTSFQKFYEVLTAGSGYATTDLLAKLTVLDTTTATPTVVTSVWLNITQGTVISAPTLANVQVQDEYITATVPGVATQSTLAAVLAALGGLPGSVGAKARAASLGIGLSIEDQALLAGLTTAITATGPGGESFAITPSDSVNFTTNARSLYVGVTGDVSILTNGGATVLFKAVQAGSILPQIAKRVNATGTTASFIVGLV